MRIVAAVLFRRMLPIRKRLMFWALVWTLGPAFTTNRPVGATLDARVAPWLPFILLAVMFAVITPILVETPPLQQWRLRQGGR